MNINDIKSGSIQFWGEWFGGRPYENFHRPIEAKLISDNLVVIKFSEGEIASIYDPVDITFDEKEFSVKEASRIIFEWYFYGRDQTAENLCYIEYCSIDDYTVLRTGSDNVRKEISTNKLKAMRIV